MEGTARKERIGQDLHSKHVVYIDSEIDIVLEHEGYDGRGELYHIFTNWLTYRHRTVPDARVGTTLTFDSFECHPSDGSRVRTLRLPDYRSWRRTREQDLLLRGLRQKSRGDISARSRVGSGD